MRLIRPHLCYPSRRHLPLYVPAFHHIRRGGSWLFPNNKDSVNLDIPNNEEVLL
nr:MAG TPA: hypothetical protein [Caudoviricetes sp.]